MLLSTTSRRLTASLNCLQPRVVATSRPLSLATHTTRALSSAAGGSPSPLRIGFIGAGDISNLHFEGIAALDGAVLHGLWSRADAQVPDPAAVAAEFGCVLYGSAEALVADPDIDAVFVLTNFETHEHL